jgi:hypothetical protein
LIRSRVVDQVRRHAASRSSASTQRGTNDSLTSHVPFLLFTAVIARIDPVDLAAMPRRFLVNIEDLRVGPFAANVSRCNAIQE